MKTAISIIAMLLIAAPVAAQEQPSPAQALLKNITRVRAAIDQEDDKEAERAKVGAGPSSVLREPGSTIGELRWRVSDNMRNIREPFRCLDVDIEKNAGPVVLVCGNNSGSSAAVQSTNVNSGNKFYGPAPAGQP